MSPIIHNILDQLVAEGIACQGVYCADKAQPQWVNQANLIEIHRKTMQFLKRELSACAPYEVMDFMTRWQHLHPDAQLEGMDGLREVIRQLQGTEIIQGVLEPEILAGRVADYRPEMLERLMASGEVCWRRVHPTRIHRVMITLCFRRDMPWLTAGREVELNGAETADADIREQIVRVRNHFRKETAAFFDDVVCDTGLSEAEVTRAVWHLAWCGEITCDTYEGMRQADFRATLSACYDLATTPRNIMDHAIGSLGWDMTSAKVLDRIHKLGLDARLGHWSITERLAAEDARLDRGQVFRNWAVQLLRRWGVVTREMVGSEVAAPRWSELLPELKRLELLGEVQRGYFIEHHHGEQYGLPEAIELLRECRGRREEGEGIGYVPDEPLLRMTSRDPADLYASNLEIVREDGEVFKRRQKAGNVCRRSILQAGQVLVYVDRQIITLERAALRRCFELLCADPLGRKQKVSFKSWNGYPICVSPAAGVMVEAGYGLTRSDRMEYPAPRRHRAKPDGPKGSDGPKVFLPYYAEPPPVEYGREWTIGLVDEPRRNLMARVLDFLVDVLPGRGWKLQWHSGGLDARYLEKGHMRLRIGRKWFEVGFSTPGLRDEAGRRRRMAPWAGHRVRISSERDLGDAFLVRLAELLDQAEDLVNRLTR